MQYRIDTLSGDFIIYQPQSGQRYSTDDMMTAWMAIKAVEANPVSSFLDLGSGLCSVPMIVLWKFSDIIGVGIELRDNRRFLGLRSLKENGIDDRFELNSGDLRELKLERTFPLVTSTPPYYTEQEGPVSSHDDKSSARFELNGNIDDYFRIAAAHLSESGKFITVYPFLYRNRVNAAAKKNGMFVNKRVDMFPRDGKPPLISLFECSFSESNEETSKITIRDKNGAYTDEYNEARKLCGFKVKK